MTKKKRNKKTLLQNKRNKLLNRRYKSVIKSLSKLLVKNIENYASIEDTQKKEVFTVSSLELMKKLTSVIDKGTKKKVFHKNNAARKKSKLQLLINKKLIHI